jgi:hypothetical protein
LEAVVDGVAASAALPEYLPVFESGDDVFDNSNAFHSTSEALPSKVTGNAAIQSPAAARLASV